MQILHREAMYLLLCNVSAVVQSPVATKADDDDNKPEGSGDGPDSTSPQAAPTPPQPQAWNPFKSRAKLPLPAEPMPSEEDEAAGNGEKGSKPAKHGRPFKPVPSDHEILTSLPADKIWGNMQQHASEGMRPFAHLLATISMFVASSLH